MTNSSSRSRLPGSTTDTTPSLRRLLRVDVLILDDLCLHPIEALDTPDVCETVVERHRQQAATIVTSNREPIEWLAMMADAVLAQSAIDWAPTIRARTYPRRLTERPPT